MSFFVLPQINIKINPERIKLKFDRTNKGINFKINKTLSKYLIKTKQQINENITWWDNTKKYTNPFEFIHTAVPGYKYSVSRVKPLSRSFFKLIEIYTIFKFKDYFKKKTIRSFHLAEGPGGFMEAMCFLRSNLLDIYTGMTLIHNNAQVPGWKKSQQFIKKNINVQIEYGADKTGDLYNAENFKHCIQKYGPL